MQEFILFFRDMILTLIATVNTMTEFDIFGVRVGYFSILFGFMVLAFIISIFWKGARS